MNKKKEMEPLFSNSDLEKLATGILRLTKERQFAVYERLVAVRGYYERDREVLHTRIAELEQQLITYRDANEKWDERVLDLERRLAEKHEAGRHYLSQVTDDVIDLLATIAELESKVQMKTEAYDLRRRHLDAAQQRIDELEDDVHFLFITNQQVRDYVAQLQKAETWRPVEDGIYELVGPVTEERYRMIVSDDGEDIEQRNLDTHFIDSIFLPGDLRLCRRTAPTGTQEEER